MPTYDKTNGSAGQPWDGTFKPVVLHNRVDCTGFVTVNADVVQALDVPAGFLCLGVRTKVVTASVAGNSIDVGDGAGADSWDANLDFTSAATDGMSAGGTDAYATAMKLYAAADTIDFTVNASIAGAVVDIWAFGFIASYSGGFVASNNSSI